MDIPLVLAIWLHTVGLVIAWGYYGVLGRMVVPALEASLDGEAQARTLLSIERRALPLVGLSTLLFVVTGTYLLFVNAHYAGLGNFFANTWTTLMLLKHLVVVVLGGLAFAVDFFIRRASRAVTDGDRRSDIRLLRLSAEGATGVGALMVLMTAAAQVGG